MRERAAICSRVGRSFVTFAAEAVGMLGGKARIYRRTETACTPHIIAALWQLRRSTRFCLSLAVLRGMVRQFERGFATADGDVEGDHNGLCLFEP